MTEMISWKLLFGQTNFFLQIAFKQNRRVYKNVILTSIIF